MPKWKEEGGETTNETTKEANKGDFLARFMPEMNRTIEQIEKTSEDFSETIVDARIKQRFEGQTEVG